MAPLFTSKVNIVGISEPGKKPDKLGRLGGATWELKIMAELVPRREEAYGAVKM